MKKLIMTFAALSAALLGWAQPEPSSCVDEFGEYTLVYAADLPATHTRGFSKIDFPYEVNRAKSITKGSFDRIGYWLQLTKDGTEQYVWVSMDAFTDDAAFVGVPTKKAFQTYVDNLHVYSNVSGVRTGTIDRGNIEFWPNSYLQGNDAGIPGASDSVYDFGDKMIDALHGQMEVADYQNKATIFNYSGFTVPKDYTKGLGIGNSSNASRTDWTENANAPNYSRRRLEVYVRLAKESVVQPLELVSAELVSSRQTVALKFSAPLAETDFSRFVTLDNAVVRSCELCETDPSLLYVRVARVPADVESLTVTVTGLADTSANANTFAGGSVTSAVTFAGLPAEVVANVPDEYRVGYELVHSWDIPCAAVNYRTTLGHIPYDFSQSDYSAIYDRVAYYLELTKPDGTVQWVWTSMDDWTSCDVRRIGAPIDNESSSMEGCYVNNLDVLSNVNGVENGNFEKGNVEFWFDGFGPANSANIPGADAKKHDFGDDRSGTWTYGTMQVHNYLKKQTVFAINRYCFDLDAKQLPLVELGIGNDPNTTRSSYAPDWVQSINGDSYTKRVLHVMVRPASAPSVTPAPEVARDHVDEFGEYTLVYAADLPATHSRGFSKIEFPYDVDRSKSITKGSFDRIGYWLLLTKDGTNQYVWVSMDAFTDDAAFIGVPTKKAFQTYVDNLHVYSNVAGVRTGTIDRGNIEFWPNSYLQGNDAGIPGASDSVYDFGDKMIDALHGQMEVADYQNKATIFNYSGFTVPKDYTKGLGIGNSSNATRTDWTENANAPTYSRRRLEVYVRLAKTGVKPQPLELVSAELVSSRQTVALKFSAPLAATDFSRFVTLDNAVVQSCELCETDPSLLYVRVARVPADVESLTVTVTGLADTSANANTFTGGSVTSAVTFAGLPAEVVENVPAEYRVGYELVHSWDIPCAAVNYRTTLGHIPYDFSQSDYSAIYDRVAYYLELTKPDGTVQWVWTSMDDWASCDVRKIGLPIDNESSCLEGCYVDNLDVLSNVNGVENGNFEKGNIEFWFDGFGPANSANIPGADAKKHDFGDDRSGTWTYGTMQVHNYLAKQTVFAINRYCFNLDAKQLPLVELGIGNDPNTTRSSYAPDWVQSINGDSYTKRVLHVMVHPVSVLEQAGQPDVIRAVASADRRHVCIEFADGAFGAWTAAATWSLANGPAVISSEVSQRDRREIILTLAYALQAGTSYTLSGATGFGAVSATVKAVDVAIPPVVAFAVPEAADYRVVKFVDAPAPLPRAWGTLDADYVCDETRFSSLVFDRVAYLVQVEKTDGSQWVWTSMDAYTADAAKLGPSSLRRQNEFVCDVDNLWTACGSTGSMAKPDVVVGNSLHGNLEMIWSNYSAANARKIADATDDKYDFDDTCTPGGAVGYGCFSVNDYLNKKTVFNINNFGTGTGLSWGLGTQATGQPDWTLNNNAASFTRRRLWVLVRAPKAAPVFTVQPQAKSVSQGKTKVLMASAGGAVRYQWRKNGVELLGETNSTIAVPAGRGGQVDTYDVIAYGADGAMTVSDPAKVTTMGGMNIIIR